MEVFSDSGLQQEILDKIRWGQLYKEGVVEDGGQAIVLPNYSPYTVQMKIEKGQPYDHMTLRDTGAFYEKI